MIRQTRGTIIVTDDNDDGQTHVQDTRHLPAPWYSLFKVAASDHCIDSVLCYIYLKYTPLVFWTNY